MTTLRLSRRAPAVLPVMAAASGVHLATGRGLLDVGPEVAGLSLGRADLTSSAKEVADGTGLVLAALLAIAFVIRSALLDAQRWLLETTEAPSPVSAFLQAGVVPSPFALRRG